MYKNRGSFCGLKYNRQRPPTKVVHGKRDVSYRKWTEVHTALATCGRVNKTGKLSNREFNRQIAQEVSYNMREAGAILGAAFAPVVSGLKSLGGCLIKKIFS